VNIVATNTHYLPDGKKPGTRDMQGFVDRNNINCTRIIQAEVNRLMDMDPVEIQKEMAEKEAELALLKERKKEAVALKKSRDDYEKPVLSRLLKTYKWYFKNYPKTEAQGFADGWLSGPGTLHDLDSIGWTTVQFKAWAKEQMKPKPRKKGAPK